MASNNPYDEGIFPDQPAAPAPALAPPVSNPYDVLPTPIGPEASAVTRAADKPYSAFNTAGRMATDALVGIPDAITGIQHGISTGFNRGLDYLTGATPPPNAKGPAIPYLAPMIRKAAGVAELPEDAGLGRSLTEGVGSAVVGGLGSAATRGVVRGVKALPEVAASLNPWRPIKNVTENALEKSGDSWYKALDNLDVRYTKDTGPDLASAIDQGLFKPKGITTQNAPAAINDVNKLRSIDPNANVPYGTTKDYIVPRDIENIRQDLNHTRATAWQPGSARREGEAANTAISGIDNFVQNPPAGRIHPTNLNDPRLVGPVLANARGDTAAAHRLGFLEGTRDEIGTKFAAKPTASASSEAQALRDRAAAALNKSSGGGGPLYGFSDYEKQLLEKTATASRLARYGANAPTSLVGAVTQALPGGVGSHMLGLPPSVTALAAGFVPTTEYAAKKIADWGTRRSYQQAMEAIAARSPLAQSMGIAAPTTARLPVASAIGREDIAATLMAPMRRPPDEEQP